MFFKYDYLTEISQLQPDDEIWRKRFFAAIETKEISSVKKLLETIPDMTIVIRLVEHDETIRMLCLLLELEPFWQDVWRLCGQSNHPHNMLPEKNMLSFDLVRSMYFYRSACCLLEANQNKLTLEIKAVFEKASQIGSFYADFKLVKFHVEQLREKDSLFFAEAEFVCAKVIAERSEQKHSVAGMMLSFYAYYQYAQKLESFLQKEKKLSPSADKKILQKIKDMSQEALLKATAARENFIDSDMNILNEAQNYMPWDPAGLPEYLFKPAVAVDTIKLFSEKYYKASPSLLPSLLSSSGLNAGAEEELDAAEVRAARPVRINR